MNGKIRNLACTFAVLVLSATASNLYAAVTVTAADCPKPKDLQKFVSKATKEADKTLILDGSQGEFSSDTIRIETKTINIEGVNNAVIDFTPTMILTGKKLEKIREQILDRYNKGQPFASLNYIDKEFSKQVEAKSGFYFQNAKNCTIKNLKIKNTQYAGCFVKTSSNMTFENVEVEKASSRGFDINGEPWNNKSSESVTLRKCWAHDCYDYYLLGEEADGFIIEHGAKNVLLEDCLSEYNSDSGYDTCDAYGEITFVRCVARYNGFTRDMVVNGEADKFVKEKNGNSKMQDSLIDFGADGNGFCIAFIGNSHLKRFLSGENKDIEKYSGKISLIDCICYKNADLGIARSNGPSPLYFKNTYSVDNGEQSFMLNITSNIRDNLSKAPANVKAAISNVENVAEGCFERGGKSWQKGSNSYDKSRVDIKYTSLTYPEICEKTGITLEQALVFEEK